MAAYPQFIAGISARMDGGATLGFAQFADQAERSGSRAERAFQRADRSVQGFTDRLRGGAAGLAAFQGPMGGLASRINATAGAIELLGQKIGAGIGIAALGASLLAATSNLQNYTQLLRSTTDSQEEFAAAQSAVLRIARETRSDLAETTRAYARLKDTVTGLGYGSRDLEQILTTVQKAVKLSGAGAQESAAAMQQFSQALGVGRLNGDEFRSLGENARVVLRGIATSIRELGLIDGFDGTIEQLRELAAEGKVTSAVVAEAVLHMRSQVDSDFSKMGVTLSQATTAVQTELQRLAIGFEDTTGILSGSATAIKAVADNLDTLTAIGAAAAVAIGARLGVALLVSTANTIATTRATLAAAEAIALFGGQTVTATSRVAGLSRGLLAVIGPANVLGIAVAGLTLGYMALARESDVTARAANLLGISQDELVKKFGQASQAIEQQNDLLRDNARLTAQKKVEESEKVEGTARRKLRGVLSIAEGEAQTKDELQAIRALQREVTEGVDVDALYSKIIATSARYPRMFERVREDVTKASNDLRIAIGATRELVDQQDRVNAEIVGNDLPGVMKGFRQPGRRTPGMGALGDGRTVAQIRADAEEAGAILDSELQRINDRYRQKVADIDAKFKPFVKDGSVSDPGKAREYQAELQAAIRQRSVETDAFNQRKAAARESKKLFNEQESAADRLRAALGRINQEFDNEPKLLDRAQEALAKIAESAKTIDPKTGKPLISSAEKAELDRKVNEGARKPLTDAIEDGRRQVEISRLLVAGREDEAEALELAYRIQDRMGGKAEDYLATTRQIVREEYAANKQRQEQLRLIDLTASAYGDVQASFRDFFRSANPKDLLSGLKDAFADYQADFLSNLIFGDKEAEYREQMVRAIDGSAQNLTNAATDVTTAAQALAAAADRVTAPAGPSIGTAAAAGNAGASIQVRGVLSAVAAVGQMTRAANDNAKAAQKAKGMTGPAETFNTTLGKFGSDLDKLFKTKFFGKLGKMGGDALAGVQTGTIAASITKALGIKTSKTGAQIGGAIGKMSGIPGADIALATIGGIVGGMFKKTPKASATLGYSDGYFTNSVTGSKKLKAAASSAGDSVNSALARIADQLGGTLGGPLSVSIGLRGKKYRVDPTGQGLTKGPGVVDFGKDGQAAAEYAVLEALRDGAIKGLRAGSQRILQAGKDLDTAIRRATKFEDVFRRLRSYTDPVGLALDDLNKQFEELKSIFKEAGASAEEYAQLEQLYGLERKKAIDDANNGIMSSLRSFLDELKMGEDSGLSLRDRQSAALAKYSGFAADINAGKKVDYDAFIESAQLLKDIERQIYGSTEPYFTRLAELTALTSKAIEKEENVVSIASATKSPFDNSGGTAPAFDPKPITDSLSDQTKKLLDQGNYTNELLGRLIDMGGFSIALPGGGSVTLPTAIRNF